MPIPHLRSNQFHLHKLGRRFQRKAGHAPLPSRSRGPRGWRLWLPIFVIVAVLVFMVGVGAFAWVSRDLPDPDKIIDRSVIESTKIYARDGTTLLYEVHGEEKRTVIDLEDIPEHIKQATIAIEDKNFYAHSGFSLNGIAKAFCHEAFGELGGLCPQRGGSTITQQFVKNSILTNERTYTRKFKELVLAYQVEKKFSKDQILKLYLNEIPYGSNAYGIESAAQTFFGKSARDLTLDEMVFLAALPQLPSYYSPYGNHVDELSVRKATILALMVEQGYITQEEAEAAGQINTLEKVQPRREAIAAPHFVIYIKEQLAERYGERMVEQGGLRVVTTLDMEKQRVAEEVVAKHAQTNEARYNASNAALVSLDTKTGQILAMVGSRDYFDESVDGNVNVALRPRQPGSSFKPLVYLSAFEKGYTPETMLFDLVTKFKTDAADYEPKNYDLREHGPVSMAKALAGSLNIPAVKTLYLAGINEVLDNAQKVGYTTLTDRSRYGLSLVLGGGEVTLLEHTATFATYAREGIRHPVVGLLRIEDSRGKVLEEFQNREDRVFNEVTTRQLNDILSDNEARSYIFGSRNHLTLPDRPVAAKTGTTNDYRDAWTMGYTPSIATGVWVGNNDNSEMRRGADGSVVAAPIWNEYMRQVVSGPAETFKEPSPNSATKPVLQGRSVTEASYIVDRVTGKLIPESCRDTYPEQFRTTRSITVVHSILHYVNRDDPAGSPPNDPAADPQYDRWEAPVQRWAAANGYSSAAIPAGDCSIRDPQAAPAVTLTAPTNGATITDNTLIASVTASSARSISRVEYYLDDTLLASVKQSPYRMTVSLKGVSSGFHDLKAVAYDDVDNSSSHSIVINYLPSATTQPAEEDEPNAIEPPEPNTNTNAPNSTGGPPPLVNSNFNANTNSSGNTNGSSDDD